MMLAESANLLIMRNRSTAWVEGARLLADVGKSAYDAVLARDVKVQATGAPSQG
jgi:hypothetical protein